MPFPWGWGSRKMFDGSSVCIHQKRFNGFLIRPPSASYTHLQKKLNIMLELNKLNYSLKKNNKQNHYLKKNHTSNCFHIWSSKSVFLCVQKLLAKKKTCMELWHKIRLNCFIFFFFIYLLLHWVVMSFDLPKTDCPVGWCCRIH